MRSQNVEIKTEVETIPFNLISSSGQSLPGRMKVKSWSGQERRERAIRKILKVLGVFLGCSSMGLVLHFLLLIIIPIDLALVALTLPLYFWFLSETKTLLSAESICTVCKVTRTFRPYVFSKVQAEMTLQCPECGQTARAKIPGLI